LMKLNSAWLVLTSIILIITKYLLSLSSISATILPPSTLVLSKLVIDVGQTCSGIESIFLFSIFYLLISTFEWKNFNKTKVMLLYIPSVIGLFLLNIIRVYLLVMVSLFVSPSFSLGILHANLGLIFFVLYFFAFWRLFYFWMKA
jgi:exosortase/archaeosortase family protein